MNDWKQELNVGRSYLAHRSRLDDRSQRIYDALFDGLKHCRTEIVPSESTTKNQIDSVFRFIRQDVPGLFWIGNTFTIEHHRNTAVFKPDYLYDSDDISKMKHRIGHIMGSIFKICRARCCSKFEVECLVHDYLVSSIDYVDSNRPEEHNIIGPFLEGCGVCEGISATFNFILNSLNIDCETIFGLMNGENHSWNIVHLDCPYHVDVTGDLHGFHTFLNVSDSMIGADRSWNPEIGCPSTLQNYHRRNGTWFSDKKELKQFIDYRIAQDVYDMEFVILPDIGITAIKTQIERCLSKYEKTSNYGI